MKFKTCVTVAEDTPGALSRTLARALRGSELAELRLDFLRPADVPRALELAAGRLGQTVCTLRPRHEGGKFAGTEAERASILKLVAEYGPHLLDVEFETLKKDAHLAKYLKRTGTDVLVSWHDFAGTPDVGVLRRRLAGMSKLSGHAKIVTMARGATDSSCVLSLYAGQCKTSLVAFAMGEYGRMSRVLCLYLGSPFTYVSLGRPVAPGQFSLAEMKKIIR